MELTKGVTETTIINKPVVNKNKYIVKRVFVGDKEFKELIWKIAETKTLREMGFIK